MSIESGGCIGCFIGGPTCVVKEVQKRLLLSFDEMHLNTSINVEIKLDIVLGHTGSSLSGDN